MTQENTSSNSPSTGEQPAVAPPAAVPPTVTPAAGGAPPTAPTGSGLSSASQQFGAQPSQPQQANPQQVVPQQGYPQQASQASFQQPAGYPQQGYPSQGFPQQAGGPQGYGAPAAGQQGGKGPLRAVGPLLMVLGAIIAIVAMFLTWNHDHEYIYGPDGGLTAVKGEAWNGWDQIGINLDAGRIYGTLMLIAFILTILASLLVLIAAIVTLAARPAGKGMGALALSGAVIGLLGTLGVMLGYLALGATDETTFAMWLYGFSFIPVLVGAIGALSKKY